MLKLRQLAVKCSHIYRTRTVQLKLWNFIVFSLCVTDYDEQSSHTSIIREHYTFLLEALDVKSSGILNELISREVVRSDEAEDINAEKTSFRANEKLLSVLSRKSPEQFQQFLGALDICGQKHVRTVIDSSFSGLSIPLNFIVTYLQLNS